MCVYIGEYSSDRHVMVNSKVYNHEIIYEIDYRGPETHSSIPPPDHHVKTLMHREAHKFGRKVYLYLFFFFFFHSQ